MSKNKKSKSKQKRQAPVIESLEPRIMMSADLPGLDTLDISPDDPLDVDIDRILAQAEEAFLTAQNEFGAGPVESTDEVAAVVPADEPEVLLPSSELPDDVRRELIIVDPSVPDYELLLAGVNAVGGEDTRLNVVVLDPYRSGIEQISEILASRSGLGAIHLISHGDDAAIRIGGDTLDLALIQQDPDTFSEWGGALSEEGDILIYGCNVAETEAGQVLIDTLAEMTRADVAASDDLTGHESLGGDWDLEYTAGDIEAEVAVSEPAQAKWTATLNQGTAIWAESGSSFPEYNTWDGTSFGAEGTAYPTGQWRIMQGAESPERDEKIVIGVDASGNIEGMLWDGSSWSQISVGGSNIFGTVSQSYWWGMDVQYESQSGDAVMAWNDGNNIEYATWDGSSWSAVSTISGFGGATPRQLQLAASPDSDEMVLIVSDSNSHDFAFVWDGSSWGNAITLSSTSGDDRSDIFIAYEQQSGDAMVVYGKADVDAYYRTWDGSSWSSEGSVSQAIGASGNVRWTTMASDPNSDEIGLGVLTSGGDVWFNVWDGSSWDTSTVATTSSTGTTELALAVAFESNSGDLIATYGESGSSTVKYMTWSAGSGWSAEQNGPSIGGVPNSMTLSSDPQSDKVMLAVNDDNSDVNYVLWDGTAWGTVTEHETNSGETKNQPFLFLWDQVENAAPVNMIPGTQNTAIDTPLVFNTTNGNLISVADSDDPSVEVTLTATNGVLTLNPGATGSLASIAGDGTDTVTFSGSLADVNAALDGLQFDPTAAFEGYATVQIATTDTGAGGAGGIKSDTDILTIEVGDVNTAPVNSVPAAQTIDQDGMLLFSSATGSAITISDSDAGGAAVEVTLTASNGVLNLQTTQGLTFTPPADGTADATMTFTGTVADINAALEGMTFVATPGFAGTAGVQIVTNDMGNSGAGGAQSDTDSVVINVRAADQKLWLTFENDEGGTGSSEIPSMTGGDVVTFGDITQLETSNSNPVASTTAGTLAYGFNLDTVLLSGGGAASDGNTIVNAVHRVGSDIQIGTNNVQLYAGDLLLSTAAAEDIGGVTYEKEDVVVFRPDTAGDYSQGSFFRLIDGKNDTGWGDVSGITLVEQTTVVGGVTLNAGEILVAHDGSGKNILRFTPGTLGDTTTGTTTILVAGTDVGIDQKVGGLHLVQADTVIGGKSLTAGELLVSLQGNDNTVGDGTTIDVLRQDIFVLNVTGTGVGSSAATAERFFEGLDEGLDNNNESIWGIGYQGNSPPVIANAGFTLDENSANGSVVGSVTANDPELGALSYAITAGNTDGAFAIDANTGQITVANSAALDYETTPGFMLTVAAIDAEGAYDTSTVEIKLNDLVENSAPTLSLANVVTSLSEATDTSSAVKVADIVVSDDGVGTNDLTLVGADAASFEIVGSELRLKAGAALDFETNPNPDVTVQVDDSSVGGTPDDSVVLGLSITDANDAPLLDNSGDMALTSIFENQANSTGTLVSDIIASAGGDRITDQDGDPEGIAITAVDNSNGTWQYSTDGGSNWFDVGAVSDGSALLLSATATDLVRFVPDTAFNGTAGISFRAWDTTDGSSSGDSGIDVTGNGGNTAFSAATESANITVAPIDIKLYLSTAGDVSGAGTAGADSWARGDIVAIGDPGFAFEADGAKDASAETSGGTFYNATLDFLNTSNTANSDGIGNVQISGMHYVGQDVMVGSTTTIDLLAGDLLLAVSHNSATFQGSDLSSVNVGREDVFVFRPDTAGDYSSGSYFLLFADVPGGGERLTGITLAEQSTVVGEGGGKRTLDAGTLLYSRGGFLQQNNIYIFEPDEVGTTTTGNRGELLVSGDDIGMGATGGSGVAITGLSLIEDNVTVDGVTLNAGNILVTLDGADAAVGNIGATAAGGMGDVYTLAVSNAGAGTTAEATLLYDASDLGLDNSAERIDAFAVLIDTTGGKQDPGLNLGGGTLAFTEDDGPTVIAPGANISDGDSVNFSGGALRVEFTVNGTLNDRLSIENQGAGASQVGLVGDLVQYEGTTVGSLSGGTGGVPLVISFNSSATDTIVEAIARAVTFDNISGDPSELTRTVQFQVTDGDGGTSALKTKDITVTAVDDNPTITSAAGASVVENSTAVMTVTATDPELDTPSFYITGGADAAFFAIDSATGALSFRDAPDFEGAADADGNNSYLVEVSARDGNGNTDSLLVTVSVTDVNETPLASDWYDADWGQRKAVTIDASQVAGSLRDFPVLVSIAADTDLAARALANGDDILFTGADGTTKLAHEIESFDSATGELRVWVKTDLSAGQDTVLYLYYGNATATSQQDPGNVWDGDFVGVWHLDEAPDGNAGVNEILDSTVNAQHGNTEGAIDATDLVTAKIGEGIDFDSVDASLIRVTDSATLDSTAGGGTFELWVNFDNTADGNHQILMSSSNRYTSGANDGFEWASQGDGDHFFYPWGGDNSNYNLGPDPFTNGQWHHLAVSFDFDQQDANIYVDGVEMAYTNEWVSTYWDTLANPADWLWGGNPDRGTRYFDGMMDEIRVSNTDRSLAWIQTSYANQWDAASFASVGAEESRALSVTEDAANDTSLGFVSGFDDDADALTYAITGGNVGNAFKINAATGEIQVNDASAIDYETLNSYTLSISVTDPEGEVDTASVAIAVTDVNEAPSVSLVNPTNTIAENTDTSSAIKVADIVINDDALGTNTLSLTGADAGSFEIAGSELRLKAGTVLDFETQASYDVSVQVDDSGVGGAPDDTAMHPFAVTNVNEAPAFNNSGGSQTFVENGSAIVLDPDHTITDPELTALDNFAGATLTLARSGGASSDDEFSASGTLSALIEGGNLDVGITTIGTVTTNSGGTLVLTFNANATNALVNQAMQQVAYSNGSDTPPASVQIDWTFDDGNSGGQGSGGALKAIGGTTVTITPVNDAPTVESTIADQNLNEDFASYTIDLNAAFADVETADGALVYGVSGNTNINVSIASGIATITPTADWNGSESLTFTATDAGGLSVSQVVGFAVTAVADIADDSAVAVTEDTATIITVLGNDSFEGTPVVTATSSPANGAVVINGDNTITYTPNSNYTGADSFTYTVTSGGVTETATVSLNVTPVNDAPTVESTIADQNLNEDFASYTIDLNAAFADVETADGALVYGVSGNTNINVSIASGIATITPTADWNGSESLTFTATDAGGLSVSQVVGFAVTAVADIADDSAVAVTEDTATIITVLGNDSFEGTPVVTATSSPANGAVVINGDNTITYTPNSNYTGADSFTYTVTSGGVTETATVSLNVTPVNDAPTVESTIADQNLNEDFASYTIDLNAAFADVETADGALVYGVSGNTNINVSIASGIATITPTADWNGSESLTFTATDAGGLSVSQVVGFAVTAVADIADDSAVAVTEDTATIITVLGNDSFEGTPVVTATSSPANGAVVINGDNTITYTPNSNYTGADSFTYTVTSGGVTETATVSLNVTPVNDAPTVESTIADQNLNEDFASYTIDLNAAFADVETADGALVYGVSGNTNINVSIASGIATITPTADWNGSESLTFTATDAGGLSVSQVVGFAVTAVADIADDSAVAVTEDTATIITVLGNDSFEGTPVVTATSSPANGAVVINGDNTITYTPNSNYTGADSFTYTVTSGGVTETATVSLNVTPVNDAPTVESTIADQNLNEDFASYTIDLNAAFADVETADGALVYGVSGNTNINVSIASGIATITPTADWNGSESLTFTATDAGGLSVSQVVGFAVTAVADIADDSAVAVTEDTATIITVLGNDSFEGTPVVTATSSPANGAVVINGDNTITYTPNSNYTGADSFTYTVTSGGVTETATVSLNVTPVNDAPTVESTIADQNLNEDFASYTIDLNAAFADVETADGALVYGVSGNTNINVSIASGIATITPTADWNGSESLTFTATDAGGLSVSQVVGFAVTAVADIADDSAVAVTEDTATIITVLGNDSFEGTPVVTATSSPANGAVVINGDNTITYTPNSNYTGADSFTYTVTSGGVTETATVSLNVTPVNDAPTVESTIADQNLNEDFASYTIDLNAAFADVETADGALVYGVSGNTNINVSIASGIATITPTADWNGSESLTFTATDAGGLSVSQVVGFAVTAVADIADDSAVAVTEDTATIITVLGNDSFEGTPVVTATSSPANGAVVINGDNTITYTPNSNYTGADSFTYTVTSGGVTETATVSLNVTPVNDAPTVESTIADQNLNEDFASYTIDLNAAFADVETADGALVYGVSGNTNINVSIASGIATITPTADWNGSESLTFTATDAGGLSVSQVVGFAVTAVADIADDSAVAVTEDTATIITVLGNDSFEGTPVVTATSSPANGAVVINGDNTITYTPNSNYTGADSFTYTVTSGGVTETATVSLNVTPVNDAPTVESTIADQNLNEDFASYTIDLNAAFADVETADGALVYGVSGNTNINVSIASGIATITPTADWNGSESLTFTATDAGGLSVSQVVGFAVTAVADIADDSAVAVTEDTATIITVLGNDSFEGTPVVTATSSPANGAVVINGDNTITYTPNSNYTGADSFTYTVTSGGVTETATVSLNVTPVNDAPTIGGIDVGAVAEDTAPDLDTLLETAGALTITDPDAGESSFVAGTVAGTHGHLIIDASGNWDYEVDNTQASIQQLDAGESINDVLTVTTADGTTHDITVTINGAEDDPVIAGSTSALVTEDGTLTVTGSLTITDADASDSPVSFPDEASTPGDNGYGDFQLTAGNWSYALNNAHATVQALAAGASLTDTHTFTASDGSTQVVSIVIAGAAEAVPPPVVEPPVPEPEPIERAAQPPETEDPVEPPAEADPAPESEPLTGATDPSASEPESEGLAASASSSRLPEPLEPDEIFLEILTDARPNDVQTVKQPAVVAKPTAETAQTFLQELKSFWKEDSTTASIEMSEVHLSKEFWNGLDKMAQDLDESIEKEDKHHRLSAEAAAGVSISLTAGFVSWAMRAGSMAASMLAALPTWRHFDPMPVLSADEKKKQAPASTEEADEETREMEKNERIERLFGGD